MSFHLGCKLKVVEINDTTSGKKALAVLTAKFDAQNRLSTAGLERNRQDCCSRNTLPSKMRHN